mgnify:CR=1 FL=1
MIFGGGIIYKEWRIKQKQKNKKWSKKYWRLYFRQKIQTSSNFPKGEKASKDCVNKWT